ncbi:MAG: hypothetical protein AABM67_03360 [Acidobacteriota bacterium]
MFDLYEELRKVILAFDKNKVDYALCGGLAMAVYDHPRATIDIDMLIPAEAFESIPEIAKELGYAIRGLDMSFANGSVEIRRVSKIHPTTGHILSLDLLLVTPAIRDVWESRVEADVEGSKLSVVSRRGLIALKELRGSGRDLDDIAALKEDIGDATN